MKMAPVLTLEDQFKKLLESWERERRNDNYDAVQLLESLNAQLEYATLQFYARDPDPFDDRHPSRVFPECPLGQLLDAVYQNDEFLSTLMDVYLIGSRENERLVTGAARLLLNILPGLEVAYIFPYTDEKLSRLFSWAGGDEPPSGTDSPLRYYATGLLAAAMQMAALATQYKEPNARLVPVLLQHLRDLQRQQLATTNGSTNVDTRPFSQFGREASPVAAEDPPTKRRKRCDSNSAALSPASPGKLFMSDCSNSSWAEQEPLLIATYPMHPLTVEMKQRLILQYLAPMAEYQELLGFALEHNALDLMLGYLDLERNKDVRLAFEACRMLGSLLCHSKFAVDFIAAGGVDVLFRIPRPSIAATGVSLCLYHLAFFDELLERVCLLPDALPPLIGYTLWLLECSHQSSRVRAAMTLACAFQFRASVEEFDRQGGLRRLVNAVSTLPLMTSSGTALDEDRIYVDQQMIRQAIMTLKRYVEMHLALFGARIRSTHNAAGSEPPQEIAPHKPYRQTPADIAEEMEFLLTSASPTMVDSWELVRQLEQLGVLPLLLQFLAAQESWSFVGKPEAVKSAVDVLNMVAIARRTLRLLINGKIVDGDTETSGIELVLRLLEAASDAAPSQLDPEPVRSALQALCTCVCRPLGTRNEDLPLLEELWSQVRQYNGILSLLAILNGGSGGVRVPISALDSLRHLACRALVGLARSERIRQIVEKLPLFTQGQLQALMREPALQDSRAEHARFCCAAAELIEAICGRHVATTGELSLDRIRKAAIVSQTRVQFNERELFQLMYQHLLTRGLHETARTLQREARLEEFALRPPKTPTAVRQRVLIPQETRPTTPRRQFSVLQSQDSHSPAPPLTPSSDASPAFKRPYVVVRGRSSEHAGRTTPSLLASTSPPAPSEPTVTLDSIVVDFLRRQHAQCPEPCATCPPFSLFKPHRCPVPRYRSRAPFNLVARFVRRHVDPRVGGYGGDVLDRRFVYSRFRPFCTYRDSAGGPGSYFLCSQFLHRQPVLLLGSAHGELQVIGTDSGDLRSVGSAIDGALSHMALSRDDRLVLASSGLGGLQGSAVMTLTETNGQWHAEHRHIFDDDYYLEFSKTSQDRIVATHHERARIYDVEHSQLIREFTAPGSQNGYEDNRATFSPADDLLLSDGLLFDVRSGRMVHKFEKFNPSSSGCFHPNGLEIVINTEVWDLRTFRLLHTVPPLDQCLLTFTSDAAVMVAYVRPDMERLGRCTPSPFESSFRTFDARDYSHIANYDCHSNVLDCALDVDDAVMSVIEAHLDPDMGEVGGSVCRLYEVGRTTVEEEEPMDEEEDVEDDERSDIGDSDDDDDDDDSDEDDSDDDDEGSLHGPDSILDEDEDDSLDTEEEDSEDGDGNQDWLVEDLVDAIF